MSVVQRARAKYYQIGGYPLSSLGIFDVEEAKRTHSLEYLQQVTNLCEKIKLTPEQFNKQSPANKLKFIKAFQYSILYSKNLQSIYDSKQQELTQRNSQLFQQIRQKKQAIKLHKQKVDKRKAQYRQMKVDQVKNVYQTFSNQISNLKSKQQELNVIKMQLQSDIQLAKHQLNNPYVPQQGFYQQPIGSNFQQQQNLNDPSLHYLNSLNSNTNLHNQNQSNEHCLSSPHFNIPSSQGFPSFNNQNQTQQKIGKHKNEQSNFTLNEQWTIIDEENQIDQMNQQNKQKRNKNQEYKIKISSGYQKKQDKKGQQKFGQKSKTHNLKLDINKKLNERNLHQMQIEELYSPTVNLVIKDQSDDDNEINKKRPQQDSFDDLNMHLVSKNNVQKRKSKQQKNSSSSIIGENDSLLLKKLNIESKISKKSSYNYDEYQFQHEIKQTPNLHFSVQSNINKNSLSYSKMGQVQGDLWTSTKGSGEKSQSNMKLFNNQPKRKKSDQIKNTIGSIRQSDLQQSANNKQKNNKQIQKQQQQQENYQNEFDDIDDLDDLDLGMDTRNSIAKAVVVNEKNDTKKVENNNMKKTLEVSIRPLQQVPQETQSDITNKGSIIHPPALRKTQQKDYPDQEQYEQDYEEQFQDQIQQSKNKQNFKQLQKEVSKNINDNKSEVEIIVPSNTSIIDTINASKQTKIFRDLVNNEKFQPINDKVQNKNKGLFPDLQVLIDSHLNNHEENNQRQQEKQNEFNTVNTEEMLQSDFDILQQTTYGKKPKNKTQDQTKKTNRNYLDDSNKLLILDKPLQSIILKQPQPATTQIIQSTTFNNSSLNFNNNQKQVMSAQKKGLDDGSLTQSIPLKKTIYQQQQDSQQIIEQDEDQISQQIEYQFQDSSKINQSQKQQIQKKIVSLVRNKNKVKSQQSSNVVQKLLKQIQNQIDQQIKLNVKQSKIKMKENDWKQITKNFQNKINELKKQSTLSQLQKKLTQIQQKTINNNAQNNKKTNQSTTKQTQKQNSKSNKNPASQSQSDQNIDLNYSQSILKDQLKTQFKNKKKLQLSEVASVNQGLTNSSKAKNQSLNMEDSDLGFSSLKQKSFVGLKNQQKQKKDEKVVEKEKKQQQGSKFKKTQEQKVQVKRDNKLMSVKQEVKTEEASRSKYVKSITPTNNKSVSKQNAFTKLQQNKYVSIEDPLNNQLALKKPILQKKVSDDDDDF